MADRLDKLIDERIALKLADARAAFAELMKWTPEAPPRGFRMTKSNHFYTKGDEDAPFFSESFLYALFEWKDPPRGLLGRLRAVGLALGIPEEDLP